MKQLAIHTTPLTGIHLIEASAGTGKTYSITRLVAKILLEHESVESISQVLVMTFTKAAAQELRARINAHLNLLFQHWGQKDHSEFEHDEVSLALFDDWASLGKTDEQARTKLRAALVELDTAPISTIHSFCQRILQDHAFLSALPMQFSFSDNIDDLLEQAVADVYRSNRLNSDDSWHAFFGRWATPVDFIQAFRKAVEEPISLDPVSAQMVLDNAILLKQELKSGFDNLYDAIQNEPNNKPIHVEQLEVIEAWLATDELTAPVEWGKYFHGGRYRSVSSELKAYQKHAKTITDELRKVEGNYAKALAYECANDAIYSARDKLAQAKQQRHVLAISDPIFIVQQQLANDASGEFAAAIKAQYPAALVDEFQDTDEAQNSILTAVYKGNDNSVLFQIGDPKQAIYAFRGGDVFAYLNARKRAQYEWSLDTNYRSNEQLVTQYNDLFAMKDSIFGKGIDYHRVNGAIKGKVFEDTLETAPLSFVPIKLDDPSVDACRTQYAQWAANEIATLLTSRATIDDKPITASQIAVLVRASTEANKVIDALGELGLSAVYSGGSERIFESPEALQLVLALRGILNPYSDKALRVAMTSELFGANSTERLAQLQVDAQKWQQASDLLAELKELWATRGFLAMGLKLLQGLATDNDRHNRQLTNYTQLFELCQEVWQQHAHFEQLLQWLEQQIANPSNNSAYEVNLEDDHDLIQIVTYHGSKGLEYPVVILPFTSMIRNSPARDGITSYHDDDLNLHNTITGPLMPDAMARYQSEDDDEVARLLYVAVTRASSLCLIAVGDNKNVDRSAIARMTGYDGELGWPHFLATQPSLALRDEAAPITERINRANNSQQLSPAELNNSIDSKWQLTSFSSIAHRLKHSLIEPKDRDALLARVASPTETPQLRFALTKGAAAGNLLHDLMEHTDFSKGNFADVALEPLTRFGEEVDQDALFGWLNEVLAAPLAELDNNSLSSLTWQQTLREPEFYFSLPKHQLSDLLAILYEHRGDSEQSTSREIIEGMMHGFIDLIFEHNGRYFVSDYKSNHIGDDLADYTQERIRDSIQASNYDLQYLIYSLALHRHLKQSLPDYDPAVHFGGVYYFYLRGMNPNNHFGQYFHPIGVETLERLDQLFSEEHA